MYFSSRSKLSIAFTFFALAAVIAGLIVTGALRGAVSGVHAAAPHAHIDCARGAVTCTEVWDSEAVFGEGKYVGHDEPSTLFYSSQPGSGNQMRYELTLPKDPSPVNPTQAGKSFNFQLHPAFWFGMAMCDTQSYPEQLSTCAPDSDKNIVDPAISPKHPGTAFTELQFYPPGWVPWPAGRVSAATSCDATKWCAALNIDSLSENPVTGQVLNSTCAAITGLEYVNFAFVTKSGVTQPGSPPNPVNATNTTFTPNPSADLFMNSGDELVVTLHDTANGLETDIQDLTTGQSGSMTASAANGFGQVKFAPDPSTECTNIPYNFHPMYSTSSEKTRVTWAAHSYNIAFSDEIGHWDYCIGAAIPTSLFGVSCPSGNTEGIKGDREPTDGDDNFCFPISRSTLVQVKGCTDTNTGFDGTSYQPLWPDGNTTLRPTAVRFESPLTGANYDINYSRVAFEADLPRVEFSTCDRNSGVGCTLIPSTDDPGPLPPNTLEPAAFYPFYSDTIINSDCQWQLGNHIPGSKNDFGQNAQYGTLLNLTYTLLGGGGAPTTRYNDFRNIMSSNPCKAN